MTSEPEPASVWTVAKLLRSPGIQIPEYQRPYTWSVRNVQQLVADVKEFRDRGTYRLGTVILHGDGVKYDVVDGQQRFITLVLLAHELLPAEFDAALERHQVSEYRIKESHANLARNYAWISEEIDQWSDSERQDFARFLTDGCHVVVLQLDDIDEAFQMFDSQNTRGKPLDPTDLLKAFHIREMEMGAVPEDRKQRAVDGWQVIKPAEVSSLFADYWFKVKCWSSGRAVPQNGFSSRDIEVFKGIRVHDPRNATTRWVRPFLYAKNFTEDFVQENEQLVRYGVMSPVEYPYQLDHPVLNGETFFGSVSHYHQLVSRFGLFGRTPQLSPLPRELEELERYRHDSRLALTRNLFDCLLLYYVDRFGEQDIEAAVRLFARYAARLRAEKYAVTRRMVNNYALGQPNLFQEIRDAVHPRDVLQHRVDRPAQGRFSGFDDLVSGIWGPR